MKMRQSDQCPSITVENLSARYGRDEILQGVSFTVGKGIIFFVLGESGCGKSTLLKNMIGLYAPYRGRVTIAGIDITAAGYQELERARRNIGVLFQTGALFGSMTLAENVALPLQRFTKLPAETIRRIVKVKLGMVSLSGYENHLPAELSTGMRNRAGLARALALDPSVLFLDEPTSGLDPITASEIDILIDKINRGTGMTMVIISQDVPSMMKIADRMIMLDKDEKGIVAEGEPKYLKEHSGDPRVINFFNRKPLKVQEKEGEKWYM
jgi:phospholipid/cholesterol/gamma-HCH transport system ATP-binding protein